MKLNETDQIYLKGLGVIAGDEIKGYHPPVSSKPAPRKPLNQEWTDAGYRRLWAAIQEVDETEFMDRMHLALVDAELEADRLRYENDRLAKVIVGMVLGAVVLSIVAIVGWVR